MKKNPTILPPTDLFLGARLASARIEAKIPLEQAAKDTRIRVQRLREIETDDFSGFAHPTYARLFLIDYATYLGIAKEDIESLLPGTVGLGSQGFDYLDNLSTNHPLERRNKRPLLSRFFIGLGVVAGLVLALAVGLYIWFTALKIERVTRTTPPAAEAAMPEPSPTPSPSPSPSPSPEPSATLWDVPAESPTPEPLLTPEPSASPLPSL